MKYTSKKKIIATLSRKKWLGISKEEAQAATKRLSINRVEKYGVDHYLIVYHILKAKLNKIQDPIRKNAYMECLALNYSDAWKKALTGLYDILTLVFSGAAWGMSTLELTHSPLDYIGLLLFIIMPQWLKAKEISTITDEFYQLIIQQLNEEM